MRGPRRVAWAGLGVRVQSWGAWKGQGRMAREQFRDCSARSARQARFSSKLEPRGALRGGGGGVF